nr:phosphopantothenoylcysteine decarboxylase-like [Tanacetum cinerariifolium]
MAMQVGDAPRKPRILLAASGSVAAIKFSNLCSCFTDWAEVKAVATQAALHFIDRTTLPKDVVLYTDEHEWSSWSKIGDNVLHIELRRWADIMVIAPLSANTLGKIAGGLCDNLLTSIIRAWDYEKPIFVAPAMNTFMWTNPFTERHLMTIDELGITLIPPVSKRLACGDYGTGAMAEPSLIFSTFLFKDVCLIIDVWNLCKATVLNTLAEYTILSGADNRPPMLDKDLSSADIYSLVNHHRVAKDLWERVQLLMQDSGFAVPVFSPGDDLIACLNKAMTFLTAVASSRGDKGQNYSGTTYKGNATSSKGNTISGQARVVKCYNCQGEGHMARQCTQPKRPRNAAWFKEKAMLAEAQEAGQILDEEQLAFLADPGIPADQAQTIIPHNAVFQNEDLDTYDSDCDDLSTAHAVLMANISNYGSDVISDVPNSKTYLNDMDNQTLYDGVVLFNTHVVMPVIDDEETLILEEESRSKMSEKAKDPEVIAKKISHEPIGYERLNSLTDDFGKRFSPQQELSAELAFWFHILNPTIEPSYTSPVIVDVPSELSKVSLVNASLKNLKFHLTHFDSVVKNRTTPNALEEGEWGFEHTKNVFKNEIIPFLKYLKDIFNVFDKDLVNKIIEVQTVFDQMEAVVQQFSIDKKCLKIAKKEFFWKMIDSYKKSLLAVLFIRSDGHSIFSSIV